MFWRWWKVARGALVFTGFYLSGALVGLTLLPALSLLERDPVRRMRRNQRVVSSAFRGTLHVLRWARIFAFDPRRVPSTLPERPVIIIANHPTTIDVVATLAVYRDACVVVKRKIWSDRLLRYLFRWCGHVDGGDGSMESNIALLEAIKERLAQGFPVVVFPEGTRSPVGGLGTMLKGAFAVATMTRTDLLPVVITADPPALHKEAPWWVLPARPVDYRLRPLAIVEVKGQTTRVLQRQITALYRRELGLAADVGESSGSESPDERPSGSAAPANA